MASSSDKKAKVPELRCNNYIVTVSSIEYSTNLKSCVIAETTFDSTNLLRSFSNVEGMLINFPLNEDNNETPQSTPLHFLKELHLYKII